MRTIETLARAVCIRGGKLLLCRSARGGRIRYLPGGHIEFRETARAALARELKEELGLPARIGRFLGCCEHTFVQKGEPHAEINLVFRADLPDLATDRDPPAREDWIRFFWHPLDRLDEAGLEPAPLRGVLAVWLRRPGFATSGGDGWLG